MAEADWTALNNSLSLSTIKHQVSVGFTPPNGGGTFVHVFNSLLTTTGASGLFTNQTNFAPTASLKGGVVTGAMKRAPSAGLVDFAPMLFAGLQGNDVSSPGYLLGLGDGQDQQHIVLRKGSPVTGLPDVAPGTQGVLRRSSATYAADTWVHLRLDMIVNANGETLLKAWQNDLGAHTVSSPTWVPIPGIEDTAFVATLGAGIAFVDDPAGINSGSLPYTTSYFGFAMFSKNVGRRVYFDHLTAERQL